MLQLSNDSASNLTIVRKPLPSGRIVRRCDAPFDAGGTRSHVRSRSRPFLGPAAWAAPRLTVRSVIPATATSLKAPPPSSSASASCQLAVALVAFPPAHAPRSNVSLRRNGRRGELPRGSRRSTGQRVPARLRAGPGVHRYDVSGVGGNRRRHG